MFALNFTFSRQWLVLAAAVCLLFGGMNEFPGSAMAQVETKQEATFRPPVESDGQLTWKFEPGRKLEIVTDQSITMNMDFSVQQITSATNNLSRSTWHIQSIDEEGLAESEMTIERMKLEIDSNGTVIQYDSDSEEPLDEMFAELGETIDAIIGQSIRYKVSPQGKVSDVQVPEDMFQEQANPMFQAFMNPQMFAEMTKNSTLFFPNPNPQVGDTWEDSSEIDMNMFVLTTRTQYQYLGVEDRSEGPVHVIGVTITQEYSDSDEMEVEIVEQKTNSKIYFDGINGYLVGSVLNQDMQMNMSVAGQVIDQRVQQKTEVKVTRK